MTSETLFEFVMLKPEIILEYTDEYQTKDTRLMEDKI